jgi:hypothetical protein
MPRTSFTEFFPPSALRAPIRGIDRPAALARRKEGQMRQSVPKFIKVHRDECTVHMMGRVLSVAASDYY